MQKKATIKAELHDINCQMVTIYKDFINKAPDEESYVILGQLGNRKRGILGIEETTWKLKSRVCWLKEGDLNTKFFHKYAFERRNRNAIWRIKRDDGSFAISTAEIQQEAYSHFSAFYQK